MFHVTKLLIGEYRNMLRTLFYLLISL